MIGKVSAVYKAAAKTKKNHGKSPHRDKPNSSFDELFLSALSGFTAKGSSSDNEALTK